MKVKNRSTDDNTSSILLIEKPGNLNHKNRATKRAKGYI